MMVRMDQEDSVQITVDMFILVNELKNMFAILKMGKIDILMELGCAHIVLIIQYLILVRNYWIINISIIQLRLDHLGIKD